MIIRLAIRLALLSGVDLGCQLCGNGACVLGMGRYGWIRRRGFVPENSLSASCNSDRVSGRHRWPGRKHRLSELPLVVALSLVWCCRGGLGVHCEALGRPYLCNIGRVGSWRDRVCFPWDECWIWWRRCNMLGLRWNLGCSRRRRPGFSRGNPVRRNMRTSRFSRFRCFCSF